MIKIVESFIVCTCDIMDASGMKLFSWSTVKIK